MIGTWLLAWSLGVEAVEVSWVGGGHGANPQWSPDGSWLAFEVNNNADRVDLYVVRVNNGNPSAPQKVTIPGSSSSFSSGGSYAANPNWHPRGPLIFEAANSGGTSRIYYMMPGGSSPTEYLNTTQITGVLAWPAISPDGTRLVFTSSATGKGDLYVFQQASNKVAVAFTNPESENAPRYCSDNSTVVFSRKNYGTEDLFTWVTGATEQKPLKGGNGDQTRPFCQNGKVVYFTNERGDDHWDVAVIPQAGGERTILAKDVRLPLRAPPTLTPDGGAVVYGSSVPAQDGNIYITRLDGSGTKTINTGMTAVGDPAVITANGRTFLAFTALPAQGADWRQLHIIDVTGQI